VKYKLALAPALVAALTASALAFRTDDAPAGAAPAPRTEPVVGAPWNLEAYGPAAGDNVALKWNEQLLATIRANPAATGPTVTSRALGVLQTAEYDAWAAYDAVAKGTRLGSQLRRPAAERTAANKAEAVSYAAYAVLVDLFGEARFNRRAQFDAQMAALGYPVDTTTVDDSPRGIGNRAAQAVLAHRHADGSNQLGGYADTVTGYQPRNTWNTVTDPFRWQPLCVLTDTGVARGLPPVPTAGCTAPDYVVQKPLAPHWGGVATFAGAVTAYRVPGPPKDADGNYARAEVNRELADSSNLNDQRKSQAEYWADGPKSEFPPGHVFVFGQALSRKYAYSLDQTVKLFFLLGNAELDAGVNAWHQKYKYDSIRPVAAIRHQKRGQQILSWLGPNKGYGMVDGSKWLPYQQLTVLTPGFPEYVSGHSTFTSAGAKILQSFTGGDTFNAYVTIEKGSSKFETNVPAQNLRVQWPTFTAALDDAGLSRRLGGIHFISGDSHGRALGTQIGTNVWATGQQYITGAVPG
jgi:hypothetical protein